MTPLKQQPKIQYKDHNHHLSKWEQELDEKLKDLKGFWEHLEEIRLDHPQLSDSFDGNDLAAEIFSERVDDQINLSTNFEENKKFLDFVIESYLKQEEEEAKRNEDDNNSDSKVNIEDSGLQTWPSLSGLVLYWVNQSKI